MPVHSVYPLIDPEPLFASQTYKGNVVIVTGGTAGIGGTVALFYARAGANVVLVSRTDKRLEQHKKLIENEVPSAKVLTVSGNISDPEVGKRAVKTAIEAWNRLDIIIANPASAMGGEGSASVQLMLLNMC